MAFARKRQIASWGNNKMESIPSLTNIPMPSTAMQAGRFLLQVPKSLPQGSICPLCRVPVGRGHQYQAHIGSVQHAEAYLKEMSVNGPAYFYQMYENVPFPDPLGPHGWNPAMEMDPFMVYAMRCGVFCGFKCKGCVKQCGNMEMYRAHILCKEHIQRTSFRISDIGEDKYREIHFDVPSWPQEKLFQGRTSSVFPGEHELSAARRVEEDSYGLVPEKWPLGRASQEGRSDHLPNRWSNVGHKRGHSPEMFTDKRMRDREDSYDDRGQSARSKQGDVANQLQEMLKQLVKAQRPSNPEPFERDEDDIGSSIQSHLGAGESTFLSKLSQSNGQSEEKERKQRWGPPSSQLHSSSLQSEKWHEIGFDSEGSSRAMASKQKAEQQDQQFEEKVLYISGLPPNIGQKGLLALCSPYGKVVETRIFHQEKRFKGGNARGFVEMASRRECLKVIQSLNGHTMPGCKSPLVVKFANKKKGSGGDSAKTSLQQTTPELNIQQQSSEHTPSYHDNLLEEAKRREEELRREVQRKEEELRKDAERLEVERKEAELRKKMEQLDEERRLLAREREQERLQRLKEQREAQRMRESAGLQNRMGDRDQRLGVMNENEIFEAQLHEAQLRELEIRKQQMHEAEMREAQLREANLREAQAREAQIREAQIREARMREAQIREAEMQEAQIREAQLREAEIRQAQMREVQERELIEAQLRARELEIREREMHEAEIREIQLREMREREMMKERMQGRGQHPPSLLDLPIQPPDARPMETPQPELMQNVLEILGQLENMGVHEIEMLPQLLDVVGELNQATLRVLGDMEPAMLEQFCVVDPEMLMQLANTMPELRHLVEQVNLPVLIGLLRAIGPQAVQRLAQAFAVNTELFVCMRGLVQNMMGGQPMGEGHLPPLGDGILPVPHEPLGVIVARHLEMLRDQLQRTAV